MYNNKLVTFAVHWGLITFSQLILHFSAPFTDSDQFHVFGRLIQSILVIISKQGFLGISQF